MESIDKHEISDTWQSTNFHVFWKEIAGQHRTVQLYENERTFLLTLEGFAGSGLLANDRVIIFATRDHIDQLNLRLHQQITNLHHYQENELYIPLDINDLITRFMTNDQFDEEGFLAFMAGKLNLNQFPHGVRVFSEIITPLLASRQVDLIRQLDTAWEKLHNKFSFSHFRAFPLHLIETEKAPLDFYNEQSFLIKGTIGSSTDITYRPFRLNALHT